MNPPKNGDRPNGQSPFLSENIYFVSGIEHV